MWEKAFDSPYEGREGMNQYDVRRKLSQGGRDGIEDISPEFERYGFKTISFVHVLLAKIFFLPIMIFFAIFLFCFHGFWKLIFRQSKCVDKFY